MRAKRRHELQHNVLAAELSRGAEYVKQHRTAIVWGLVLALAVVLAVTYVIRSRRQQARTLQETYDRLTMSSAVTPQEFLDGMKTLAASDDEHLAALATLQVGKYYAAQFVMRGAVWADPRQRELAEQAEAYFRQAIQNFPDERAAVAEGHLGLARVAESKGDFATAAEEYKHVRGMVGLAGTPAIVAARDGLAQLEQIRTPVRMATTTSAPAETD